MSTKREFRAETRTGIVVFLLCVLMTFGAVAADDNRDALSKELDTYLTAAHEVWNFHGSALVARNGRPIIEKGYGMASIELGVPNTPDMKFLIGSITKQFTATAIMQLAERGLLEVTDPITKYLPGYPKETGDRITIHHLLTHGSGIPSYTDDGELMEKRTLAMTLEELIAVFKDDSLHFEPGTRYEYSNSGYILLGAIIETVSGQSYEDYLKEHIFEPLGMTNTGYAHNDMIIQNRACGYYEGSDGGLRNAVRVHMSLPYSAGSLYSTVGDMLIWDQALYTERVLSDASLRKMFTPHNEDYGYGWSISDRFNRRRIAHGGGIDGFSTTINRFVDDSVCIAVLGNNAAAPIREIAASLAAIVFDEPYDVPVVKTPIAVDNSILPEYVGVYEISSGEYRVVTLKDDTLYSRRANGNRYALYPEATDKFFFEHDHTTTLTFIRDDDGGVMRHIIHQKGRDESAEKIVGDVADSILAAGQPVNVDPAVYDRLVGEYEFEGSYTLTVTRRGNRIYTQLTGQPEYEIYPASELEYYFKVASAQVIFVVGDNDEVTGLVFHQGDQEIPGTKIK